MAESQSLLVLEGTTDTVSQSKSIDVLLLTTLIYPYTINYYRKSIY